MALAEAVTPEVDLCDYSEPSESAGSLSDDSGSTDGTSIASPVAAAGTDRGVSDCHGGTPTGSLSDCSDHAAMASTNSRKRCKGSPRGSSRKRHRGLQRPPPPYPAVGARLMYYAKDVEWSDPNVYVGGVVQVKVKVFRTEIVTARGDGKVVDIVDSGRGGYCDIGAPEHEFNRHIAKTIKLTRADVRGKPSYASVNDTANMHLTSMMQKLRCTEMVEVAHNHRSADLKWGHVMEEKTGSPGYPEKAWWGWDTLRSIQGNPTCRFKVKRAKKGCDKVPAPAGNIDMKLSTLYETIAGESMAESVGEHHNADSDVDALIAICRDPVNAAYDLSLPLPLPPPPKKPKKLTPSPIL